MANTYPPLNLIVAYDQKSRGIGFENQLPWIVKEDLKYFKKITSTTPGKDDTINAVIMGHNMWESLPNYRSRRLTVVLSSDKNTTMKPYDTEFTQVCHSLEEALSYIANYNNNPTTQAIDQIFIVGVGQVYRELLSTYVLDRIYITEIYYSISKGGQSSKPV